MNRIIWCPCSRRHTSDAQASCQPYNQPGRWGEHRVCCRTKPTSHRKPAHTFNNRSQPRREATAAAAAADLPTSHNARHTRNRIAPHLPHAFASRTPLLVFVFHSHPVKSLSAIAQAPALSTQLNPNPQSSSYIAWRAVLLPSCLPGFPRHDSPQYFHCCLRSRCGRLSTRRPCELQHTRRGISTHLRTRGTFFTPPNAFDDAGECAHDKTIPYHLLRPVVFAALALPNCAL